MTKYIVDWSKTYYTCGEVVVEAESPDGAWDIASDKIGDLTGGSLQYDPDGDQLDVIGEVSDG
jgi:hypothetical protein